MGCDRINGNMGGGEGGGEWRGNFQKDMYGESNGPREEIGKGEHVGECVVWGKKGDGSERVRERWRGEGRDDDRKDRDRGGGLENRIDVYAGGDRDRKWKELKS